MRRRLLQPLATLLVASALLSVAFAVDDTKEAVVETRTTTVEVKKADAPKAVTTPTGTTTTTTTVVPAQPRVIITKEVIIAPAVDAVQKKGVPAPAKAANEAAVKVRAAQLQVRNVTMAQRYEQQLRGKLRGDYLLLVSVCGPTKAQRREIARAGEKALKDAALQVAQAQQNGGRVIVRNGVVQQDPAATPDPDKIMSDALIAAAKTQLPEEKVSQYVKEIATRSERHKEAVIRDLTASLDRALLFSPEQREKVNAALSADKSDTSHVWSRSPVSIQGYFPQLPETCIVPFLSPAQAKVWRAAPKFSPGFNWGNGNNMVPQPLEDAELDGAEQAGKD